MSGLPRNRVIVGDAVERLRQLPDASVDTVVTSPPYFRLRDYQVDGQIGLEASVDEWVDGLRRVAQQVARVLVPTGSFWLNVGDTYSTHAKQGAGRKSLLLGPERLALALVREGWTLRNKVVWAKKNPMPTSVRDRLSCTYEVILVFTRQAGYYFDLDAIRQPHRSALKQPRALPIREREAWRGPNGDDTSGLDRIKAEGRVGHPLGKNPGDVWQLASSNYRGAHHATYPVPLVERMLLAGCPAKRCTACRAPWKQRTIRAIGGSAVRGALGPTCECQGAAEPGIVLDPFLGSGTTAVAAERLGRDWLGIELSADFATLARQRITDARAPEKETAHDPPLRAA